MNTKLIPLLATSAEGIGIFKTFGGVKRTGSDDTGIQMDLTFYWPVRTSSEAKELDPVIAGASAMYADRDSRDDDDPAKSEYSVSRKFQDDARHLTLNLVQDGGEGGGRVILSDQSCSVISAVVKTSKKAASYEIKIRLFGLTPKQVGDLAEGLTAHVNLTLEDDQKALFGKKAAESNNVVVLRPMPKTGQLVSGKFSTGAEFAGLVKEIGDSGLVTIQDFDRVYSISISQITSSLDILPPKGKQMDWVINSYQERAKKKGTVASWAAILAALVEVHATNLAPTESWVISSAIIDGAAKIQTAPTLPELSQDGEEEEDEDGEMAGGIF